MTSRFALGNAPKAPVNPANRRHTTVFVGHVCDFARWRKMHGYVVPAGRFWFTDDHDRRAVLESLAPPDIVVDECTGGRLRIHRPAWLDTDTEGEKT